MLQIYLKNKNFAGFFQVFWLKTEKDFQRTSLINCCCYSIKKNHHCIYLQIFFETVFFKMLETDIEVLGKGFFPLNILQPHIMNSRKLRFGFFVEWLAQPTAAQFGIFNRKHQYFLRCLLLTWNVFYEVFFISEKQTFYVMKFVKAISL